MCRGIDVPAGLFVSLSHVCVHARTQPTLQQAPLHAYPDQCQLQTGPGKTNTVNMFTQPAPALKPSIIFCGLEVRQRP